MNIFKRIKERRETRRRYRLALEFNRRATLKTQWKNNGQWMCPTCNRVHNSNGWTPWTGSQYPACCDFQEGHRTYWKLHATDSAPA